MKKTQYLRVFAAQPRADVLGFLAVVLATCVVSCSAADPGARDVPSDAPRDSQGELPPSSDLPGDAVSELASDVPPDLSSDVRPDVPADVPPDLPPSGVPVPVDLFGMCPMDGEPTAERWEQMATWGVKIARQGFFWEWISKPDGSLDFSWPDRYFDEAEKRGIGVLVVLDYDHPDLHQPGAPRPYIPVEAHDRWITYVRAVASRYKDRAWGFEVWNEPNLLRFWRGTQEEFVSLARVTVLTVREAAPGVPVAVAGLSLMPLDWLNALHAEGVVEAADAISFHPYWVDAEGALDMVDMAVEWLDENGLEREMWLTEYGWPTGGEYPTATDLDGQAERLVRFAVGMATRGVRASWWYASHDYHDPDDVGPDASSEEFFGVAWPTAGDKPAARAFAVLAHLLPGTEIVPAGASPLEWGGAVRTSAFLRPDGAFVVVATNAGEVPAKRTVPSGTVVEWPDSEPVAEWSEVEIQPGRSVVLSIPAGGR